jgi:hypothetical protein
MSFHVFDYNMVNKPTSYQHDANPNSPVPLKNTAPSGIGSPDCPAINIPPGHRTNCGAFSLNPT